MEDEVLSVVTFTFEIFFQIISSIRSYTIVHDVKCIYVKSWSHLCPMHMYTTIFAPVLILLWMLIQLLFPFFFFKSFTTFDDKFYLKKVIRSCILECWSLVQ